MLLFCPFPPLPTSLKHPPVRYRRFLPSTRPILWTMSTGRTRAKRPRDSDPTDSPTAHNLTTTADVASTTTVTATTGSSGSRKKAKTTNTNKHDDDLDELADDDTDNPSHLANAAAGQNPLPIPAIPGQEPARSTPIPTPADASNNVPTQQSRQPGAEASTTGAMRSYCAPLIARR